MRATKLNRCITIALAASVCLLPQLSSAQTLERIAKTGVVNIGYVPDEAPFSSKSDGDSASGFSIDLGQKVVDAVAAKSGRSDLKVNYVATDLASSFDKVAAGQIDLLCAASTETLARREKVSFSTPIYTGGIGALLRDNAAPDLLRALNGEPAHVGPLWRATVNRGLSKHTYAVHAGTVTEAWVQDKIKQLGVLATVVTVKSHEEGLELVKKKKADAYFADRVLLKQAIRKDSKADDLYVLDRYFDYEPIALALARNDDDFRLLVDTTLSDLYQTPEFWDIYLNYFEEPSDIARILYQAYTRP